MGFKFDESAEQLKTSSRQEVFVSRLEENLETKINKLIQEDTEKAVVLEQLKKELISEIKIGYQEESYIEDLRLDLKELEEIYNMPHLKVLFEEANIATFDQFMDLLSSDIMKSKEDGISGLDEDEYLIGGQLIRLGLDVKYMRSQVCDHLKDILRGVLSKPILANTIILESIKSIGSNVISFFTVENGNAIEYIAVRNSIYRLKECSDPRKVGKYPFFQTACPN